MKLFIRTSKILKYLEKEIEELEKERFKNLFTSGRVMQIKSFLRFIKKL